MRHSLNPSIRAVLEELQGQTVVPTGTPAMQQQQQGVVKKPMANGPQQIVAGVQNTAQNAAQQAANGVVAQQQGTTPTIQQQATNTAAAQPQPAKITPQAQARGNRDQIIANRKAGQSGQPPAVATESEIPLPTDAPKETESPGEEEDYNNQGQQTKRAKERAKEIDVGSAGPNKTSTMGEEGAGKGQKHHEVTKAEDLKSKINTSEAIFTEKERNDILSGVFG